MIYPKWLYSRYALYMKNEMKNNLLLIEFEKILIRKIHLLEMFNNNKN